jgi:hypothetical protein
MLVTQLCSGSSASARPWLALEGTDDVRCEPAAVETPRLRGDAVLPDIALQLARGRSKAQPNPARCRVHSDAEALALALRRAIRVV